jgi:pimeloyl-ACP methyl ester carboxylesterase
VAVLDALGIERASVVGHSLGGTVAIFLAANHSDRVDRVVLAGSAISFPWSFALIMTPGPGELFLASRDVFGPTLSPAHRAEAVAAYRIRGTRDALLRYVRRSILEAGDLSPPLPLCERRFFSSTARSTRRCRTPQRSDSEPGCRTRAWFRSRGPGISSCTTPPSASRRRSEAFLPKATP